MLVRLKTNLILAAEWDGKDSVINNIVELLTVSCLDPSPPTSPDVQLSEMRMSHCLIQFKLGLLFIKAEVILTDPGSMDVGDIIYGQAGTTSLALSIICSLDQLVPLTYGRVGSLQHSAMLEVS